MTKQTKKIITRVLVRGEEFIIIFHQDRYCAINTKYLDENGCTTKVLNGFDMHASKTLSDCVREVRMSVEVKYLMKQGMTLEEALNEFYRKEEV